MEELWQEIWQTIRRNKWRSLMTAFGVFWGLLMLILLVGFGHGIFNGIIGNLNAIPSNTMFFGGESTSMAYKGFGKNRYITLDNEDMEILKTYLDKRLRYLTPINVVGSQDVVFNDFKYSARLMGSEPSYYNIIPQQVLYGRYINDIDIMEHRKVCVMGVQVYETLFPGGGDPCGKLVKVGSVYYTIIGVVKKLSNYINIGGDVNKSLLLPITTTQFTYNMFNSIHICGVTLQDKYPISEWEDRIKDSVKEHHYVHPDDKKAFWGFNLSDIMNMFNGLFLGINILLWIVGCGSLFAGLIGISNIMLVTVKERTQEIGIRRALGAKPLTILSQILAESLVLTSAAGVTGLMLGVWILTLVGKILEANPSSGNDGFQMQNPEVPFSVAVAGMLVIIVGGLLAGWMPAKRAMKIRAIEALREE